MSEWMPIKTCPANTSVEYGFWETFKSKPEWKIRSGIVFKRILGFKVHFSDYTKEASHWRHLPPPPKDQENV